MSLPLHIKTKLLKTIGSLTSDLPIMPHFLDALHDLCQGVHDLPVPPLGQDVVVVVPNVGSSTTDQPWLL